MDTCKDIFDLLSDYLDGDLAPERREAFEAHMSQCPPCVEYLDSLRQTQTIARSLRCEQIPGDVQRMLRTFLERELRSGKP
ncbi:MAG: anti-sigma factor family protein [Acidobacteriota bacterium]